MTSAAIYPLTRPARPNASRLAVTLIVAVTLLAAAGLVLAAKLALTPATPTDPSRSLPTLQTSFGAVDVLDIHRLGGPTSQQLGGMAHGVPGLVSAGQAFVQLQVRISADPTGQGGTYAFDQFAVQAAGAKAVAPMSTSFPAGNVSPGMAVQGSIGFVVPVDTAGLTLLYQDPGNRVVSADLGRLPALTTEPGGPKARTPDLGEHHH
ncbi:MAG: hypothetical protein H0V07_01715 [Propionibacteriales bacterium]|nr:hypothetical protein [Propionibacteriales bacterium]